MLLAYRKFMAAIAKTSNPNMKLKNTLLTIIYVALIATSAHAVIYTDLDVYNGFTGRLVNGSNPLNGQFQISSQDADGINDLVGYNPDEEIITATASFLLYDDSFFDGSERVTINLGSDPFVDNSAASFLFAVGGVSGNALFDLSADGILSYSIVANSGDFRVNSGLLTVDARARTVPDGGTTAVLLGMAFLGICAVQRKFALAP